MLLTAGERISMALLAMAIKSLGVEASSYTGSQAGMLTDAQHGKARIVDVTPKRVREALDAGHVAIVAGFQGFNRTTGRSPPSAAVAPTRPPSPWPPRSTPTSVRSTPTSTASSPPTPASSRRPARSTGSRRRRCSSLAASGAKVLYIRAVEYARRHGVTLHVRSSFSNVEGTIVYNPAEGETVEEPIITGIAGDLSEGKITVVGVPDQPGKAAEIFTIVARAGANIDMIVQNVSAASTGRTDISFTLPKDQGQSVLTALEVSKSDIGYEGIQYDDQIGKLALVGAGMRTNAGVSAQLFRALHDASINIEMISTSEIRISVVTRADTLNEAMRVVHEAFGLDADNEAVVYAGTGR